MPDLERIRYKGLDQETIADYLDEHGRPVPPCGEPEAPLQGKAAEQPVPPASRLARVMRRIMASRTKREAIRAKLTDPLKPVIDIGPLMGLEDADFLDQLIFTLYFRVVQPVEKRELLKRIKKGASHEAVAYILCCSEETGGDFAIANFGRFEAAYFQYRNRSRAANIPVVNYIVALATAPMRLKRLEASVREHEVEEWEHAAQVQEISQHYGNMLHWQSSDIRAHLDRVAEELRQSHAETTDNLKDSLYGIRQSITGLEPAFRTQIESLHTAQATKMDEIAVFQSSKMDDISAAMERAADERAARAEEITAAQAANIEALASAQAGMQAELSGFRNAWEKSTRDKTVFPSYPGGITVVNTGAALLGVPSEDWRLAAALSLHGHMEPGVEAFLRSYVERGMTVVDAGANIGVLSVLMAQRVGPEGRLFAFEPAKGTYDILRNNLALNGFEFANNIIALNSAASNREGEASFHEYKVCGHNSMYQTADEAVRIVTVPTVSLDSVLHGLRADLVKIDVEGAEPLVLAGMKETMRRNPNLKIVMEFGPENLRCADVDPTAFLEDIRGMGFEIERINDATGKPEETTDAALLKAASSNLLLHRKNLFGERSA